MKQTFQRVGGCCKPISYDIVPLSIYPEKIGVSRVKVIDEKSKGLYSLSYNKEVMVII